MDLGSQEGQGVTGNTVHTSRREGQQEKVFEGFCFHCGKPVSGHVAFWLYWLPNTLPSTYMRYHQYKQKAAVTPG